MRKIQVTTLPAQQTSIHKRLMDYPLKSSGLTSFHSFKNIPIPPLNLMQPCSHSTIFDISQKHEKPDVSTRRQDDSYGMSQRSGRISQQLLTQRRGREQQLLIDLRILRTENEQLKRELLDCKRESKQMQRLKGEISRLSSQNKNLVQRFDHAENRKKAKNQSCKEINLYKEIVEKLQKRVILLLKQSQALKQSLQVKIAELREAHSIMGGFDCLQRRVLELEALVDRDANQWQHFKRQWMREKDQYLQMISQLSFQLKSL